MSNFRTRILGLAAMATAFVGVSYGQVVFCQAGANGQAGVSNVGSQVNPSLRAESQTELIAVYQFSCAVSGSSTAFTVPGGTATTTTGTVYVNTNLPITSKALGTTSNEATIIINGSTTTVSAGGVVSLGNGTAVAGTVSGSQVSFVLPAATIPIGTAAVSGAQTFEVTNIRVNASAAGAPQVTESGLLSYVVPNTTSGLITANLALPVANGPG